MGKRGGHFLFPHLFTFLHLLFCSLPVLLLLLLIPPLPSSRSSYLPPLLRGWWWCPTHHTFLVHNWPQHLTFFRRQGAIVMSVMSRYLRCHLKQCSPASGESSEGHPLTCESGWSPPTSPISRLPLRAALPPSLPPHSLFSFSTSLHISISLLFLPSVFDLD